MAHAVRFRSYIVGRNDNFNCTIWEAVRATTASPLFFAPINIGSLVQERFIDGGYRCNNPVAEVYSELRVAFPSRPITSLISIGTGHTKVIKVAESKPLPKNSKSAKSIPSPVVDAWRAIVEDCEHVSSRFEEEHPGPNSIYTRLNVEQGMLDIALDEWAKLGETVTHTRMYLQEPRISQKVDNTVNQLRTVTVPPNEEEMSLL